MIQVTMTMRSGIDARQQRQVLIVGIGAHRLAGARAVEEQKQGRDHDDRDDDGDRLRCLDRQPLVEAAPFLEVERAHQEAFAVCETTVLRAHDEAHDGAQHEHHPDRGDHQHHRRRAALAVEGEHRLVDQDRDDRGDDDRRHQRQQRRRQHAECDAVGLQQPGEQDGHRRAEGHQVAMGEIGEPQMPKTSVTPSAPSASCEP
jgi:hypothetical protein